MNELKIEVTKEDLCIMVEKLYHERASLLRNTLSTGTQNSSFGVAALGSNAGGNDCSAFGHHAATVNTTSNISALDKQKEKEIDGNKEEFQKHLELFNRATDLFMAVKRCDRTTFMIEGVKDENIA